MDVIPWSPDRLLEWADFGADVNPAAYEDAYSAIRYRPKWTVSSVRGGAGDGGGHDDPWARDGGDGDASGGDGSAAAGAIFFTVGSLYVTTEFWPVLSWARASCDDATLNHQQGHFDLGEIVMRREIDGIRQSLYGRRFPTRGKNEDQRKQLAKEDSALVVEPVMASLERALEKEQARYDADTRHGDDLDAQLRYDELFAALRT